MSDRDPTGEAFRQFQYPTLPLAVSDEWKNQVLAQALAKGLGAQSKGGS